MDALYNSHGVTFRYPGGWELSEQREGEQLSITVSSPHAAFWTVSLFPGRPDPADIVAAAVDAFHAAALEAGGASDGEPGLRPHYYAGYYAAFVRDPDGNRIEAVTFLRDKAE